MKIRLFQISWFIFLEQIIQRCNPNRFNFIIKFTVLVKPVHGSRTTIKIQVIESTVSFPGFKNISFEVIFVPLFCFDGQLVINEQIPIIYCDVVFVLSNKINNNRFKRLINSLFELIWFIDDSIIL